MSFIDICDYCDGSGEMDFLSGQRCCHCGGTGMREEIDEDDDSRSQDEWIAEGPWFDDGDK